MIRRFLLLPALATLLVMAGCGGSGGATRESHRSGTGTTEAGGVRGRLVHEARSWLGTPYNYGGLSRSGIDCSGLTSRIFHAAGLELPRTARDQFETGTLIMNGRDVRPGDLVFFRNTAGRGITHVGIFIGSGSFIHASTRRGVIVSSFAEAYYRDHYAGARNVLGDR